MATAGVPAAVSADAAPALETARCFLDTLLAGDPDLAEALLADAAKVNLSGEAGDSDKKAGWAYNRGLLKAKMRSWKAKRTGYQFGDATKDGNVFVLPGNFVEGAQPDVKFEIRIGKVDDAWRVTEFLVAAKKS